VITEEEEVMAIPGTVGLHLDDPETLRRLKALMAPVEFKVGVAGTRPGVGVSTLTLNLALAMRQVQSADLESEPKSIATVGILDLGGSQFPERLGPLSRRLKRAGRQPLPVNGFENVKVVTLQMLMGNRFGQGMANLRDWSIVQKSLAQVDWNGIGLLLIEFPSGIEMSDDLSEVLPPIDAGLIVSRPEAGERERIRRIWKFLDTSGIPAIGLVSNMEGRYRGETVEDLGQTFGIPIRVTIPYEPMLATTHAGAAPYILAKKGTKVGRTFLDVSEDLVDYLVWLHDEHEQEEDF
jgi:Mrp family chromosome partitioning ATPase